MDGRIFSIDELREEIVAELVMLRRNTLEGSTEETFVNDVIRFAKTWSPQRTGAAPPPGMQFVHFTVNGQPVDPTQFQQGMNNAQDFGNNSGT